MPPARAGRDGLGVPLPRPGRRPDARWSSRSARAARPPTRSRPLRHARSAAGVGPRRHQHRRLDDQPGERRGALHPRPGPRSRSRRPRRSSRRSPRCTSSGSTWRRSAAPATPTRCARTWPTCRRCPDLIAEVLGRMEPVRALAREIAGAERVLFLGRHVGYPIALEGALKLKELAYVSAEGFPAGEIKHGPIALIEPGHPGRRHRAAARAAGQAGQQRAGGPRPRRPHDRASPPTATTSVTPYADDVVAHPGHQVAAHPAADDRAAAGAVRRDRHRPRARRRPAAQPRQVRHGRVGGAPAAGRRRRAPARGGFVTIVGVGVDVVDVARFERALARTPRLADRLFTAGERRTGRSRRWPRGSRPRRRWPRRSARRAGCAGATPRWSAASAAGRGWRCTAASPRRPRRRASRTWHLSLSHDGGIATAVVVAES